MVEEARACVDDMRANKSGNVGYNCDIGKITESYQTEQCCPKFVGEGLEKNLLYSGSAYPETLRCIEQVGCGESVIYTLLLEECYATCPVADFQDRFGDTACLADFNSAPRIHHTGMVALPFLFMTAYFLLF
jgi:hypothetical protein